jgi:hypothetical protein
MHEKRCIYAGIELHRTAKSSATVGEFRALR